MPTFYHYTQDGLKYSFDDVFVPADAFRQGNLWTWGGNYYGQLGNNTGITRSAPVTTFAGGVNWKQVACGDTQSLAIKTDGTLWTWGDARYGALGVNTVSGSGRSTPVTTFAGGNNWKQVSSGDRHSAAIKTDGTLWVWGFNTSGQIGTNNTTQTWSPVTTFAGGTNWKQVSCGYRFTAAIKTDGTLWIWGSNSSGKLGLNNALTQTVTPVTTFAGGTNWKQVACGNLHTAAIKTDGTLWTWGENDVGSFTGQLGNNRNINSSTPVTTFAGGTNWKQVAAGSSHTLAIKTDGTLWTWGGNSYGALGINTQTNRNTPVTTFAGGTNWKQVFAGGFHTAAIKTDGTLWTWGSNYGKLGDNTSPTKLTPVTTFTGGTNWKQAASLAAIQYIDDYQ
jgi:alpha-tubulin suppressor-like RCC1 family protein